MEARHSEDTPPQRTGGHGLRRWFVLLAVLALAAVALSIAIGSGGGAGTDTRAATAALEPADISAAIGAQSDQLIRINPPIDVDAIVRAARSLPLVDVPMPDSRHVESFRRRDNGQEITQVFLLYDDASRAAQVDGLASSYLASALGLSTEPTVIDGVDDARRWTGSGYEAISFRSDGVFVLVGATEAGDPGTVTRLAEQARDKVSAVRPTLEAGATQTAAAAGATP